MDTSPAAARRRLGAELRALRHAAGKRIEDASHALRCSTAKVSRLENGKGTPQYRDVRDLIDYYGVACQRDDLLRLADEGAPQDWFSSYRDVFQGEFFVDHLAPGNAGRFVYLERDAIAISMFEAVLVPGLLQTAEYIAAVCRILFPEHSAVEQERFVDFRLARQRSLFQRQPNPPKFEVVLSEGVIVRRIGGPAVMRQQIESLVDKLTGELGFVDFRITPFAADVRGTLGGPFSIMFFKDPREQDVVHLEVREGASYLETDQAVARYVTLFDELKDVSLTREASIRRLAEEASRLV